MAILRNGYRVEYEDLALAYTEAPVNANGSDAPAFPLVLRNLAGGMEASRSFRTKRRIGIGRLPNILVFQILLPLVSPFIDIMFAVGSLWYFVQNSSIPTRPIRRASSGW